MYKEKTRLYKVYHIHEKGNTDINDGYVGITRHSLAYRLGQHFCSKRPVGTILRSKGRENIEIDQLAMLSKDEALEMEYNLRPPKMNLGWNVRAGGDRATVFCPPVCGKPLPNNYGKGEKYRLTSPDDTVYTPEVFTVFCREHDLNPQNLRKVAKGLRKHSNGWKAERIG